MIYFDNAATGGCKPPQVLESVISTLRYLSVNPGRSGHRLALTGAEFVWKTRKKLADFFNAPSPKRVCFTKNCTEALNVAIYGLYRRGGHVVTTCLEHNSVLRPLYDLQRRRELTFEVASPKNGTFITAEDIASLLRENTDMVVLNLVSNVTGARADVENIGRLCAQRNILLVVDGAQACGHCPIDFKKMNVDALAVAGHKGMYGIQGSGALILSERCNPRPLLCGGTGTDSLSLLQPETYPERLESGTLSLPAVISLAEGVTYLEKNATQFATSVMRMTDRLLHGLKNIPKITVYSKPNPAGIVAFSMDDLPSQAVADALSENYDIAVRGGLHCAPLAHAFLGTSESGLVRVSLSPHNTTKECQKLLLALSELSSSTV